MVKGRVQLTIPNPHTGAIGVQLLKLILQETGISRDEWLNPNISSVGQKVSEVRGVTRYG